MLQEHRFADQNALMAALSQYCLQLIRTTMSGNTEQTILLSGGNTPRPLYERLADSDLAWSEIQVALVDERWVPQTHPASNEAMLLGAFAPALSKGLQLTGMYDGGATPHSSVASISHKYAGLPRPWSLALLGMGSDGHTASLFPAAQGLEHALLTAECCAPISARQSAVTGPHLQRMTLGLQALLSVKQLILLITGDAKWQVYQQALTSTEPADMPVSYLLQQQTVPIDVFWCP